MTWKQTLIALGAILVLGAGLRFVGLGNTSLVSDEFLDMKSSYGYFRTGEWKAWDFNAGAPATVNENEARDERANVYKWQVAQVFRFLPPTEAAARSVSALWGIFSVAVMFFAGWRLSGRKTIGLFSAFLFAVSVSGLEFDRKLRMYAMFFPMFLLLSVSLFDFYEREYAGKVTGLRKLWKRTGLNLPYLVPVAFFGFLSLATHQLTLNILPIFGTYVSVMAIREWRQGRGFRNKYVGTALLGVFGVLAALLLVPDTVRKFLGTLVWFDNHYSYFGYVVADYAQPVLAVFLAGLGAWSLMKRYARPKEAVWLLVSFLVPLLMAVWFWRRNEGRQYIFFALSFLVILVSAGGYTVVREAKSLLRARFRNIVCVTVVAFAVLVPDWGYFLRENNTYVQTSTASSANYRKIFAYFRDRYEPGEALVTRHFRNYYLSGMDVPVYDFGGELSTSKLSVDELEAFMAEYPSGWVIMSDNDTDYVSRAAEDFMYRNMDRQSHSLIRGDVLVFRWGDSEPAE